MNDTCGEAITQFLSWFSERLIWIHRQQLPGRIPAKSQPSIINQSFQWSASYYNKWSCHHTPVSNTKHCSDMTCSSGILQFPAVKKMKPMCIVWASWQLFKLDRHELLIRSDTPPDAATIKIKIVFLIWKHPHNFWLSRDWHILTI